MTVFWGLFAVIFGAVAVGVALLLRQQAFRTRRGGEIRDWAQSQGLSYLQESSSSALPFGHLPFFRASRWATDVWHVAHGPDLWVADVRRAFGDAENVSLERHTLVVCLVPGRDGGPFRADPLDLLTKAEDTEAPREGLERLVVEGAGSWVIVYDRGTFIPVEELPTRVTQARAIAAALSSDGAPPQRPP